MKLILWKKKKQSSDWDSKAIEHFIWTKASAIKKHKTIDELMEDSIETFDEKGKTSTTNAFLLTLLYEEASLIETWEHLDKLSDEFKEKYNDSLI